jgi:hypothetical protein
VARLQREWEVHGLPLRLVEEYLQELGGHLTPDGRVEGPGWTIQIRKIEDFRLGSIRLGNLRLVLEADPKVMETFLPALEKKLRRGGG